MFVRSQKCQVHKYMILHENCVDIIAYNYGIDITSTGLSFAWLTLVGRHSGDSIVLICHSHVAVVASSIANRRRQPFGCIRLCAVSGWTKLAYVDGSMLSVIWLSTAAFVNWISLVLGPSMDITVHDFSWQRRACNWHTVLQYLILGKEFSWMSWMIWSEFWPFGRLCCCCGLLFLHLLGEYASWDCFWMICQLLPATYSKVMDLQKTT